MVITGEPTIFDEPSDTDSDVEAARKANPPKPDVVQETAPSPPRSTRPTVRSGPAGGRKAPQSGTNASASSSQVAVPKKVWSEQSIYKVPNFLKALNEKAYKPQMVSLGPYHHHDPELGAMNEHKERALTHFLRRMGKTRDHCREDMEGIMKDAATCYADLEEKWFVEEGKFMDVMILDGVFILEVIHIFHGLSTDYSEEDPVFSSHGQLYNFPVIRRDMLLLENQVPFLVLEKLMEFKKKPPPTSLQKKNARHVLGNDHSGKGQREPQQTPTPVLHATGKRDPDPEEPPRHRHIQKRPPAKPLSTHYSAQAHHYE
ncbi:hypothetical protein H6P81_013505 [Aristolochia fimbriata]|uniref:Uncharacterized protein n=1 Tax=Aristolochia fimbriata TaxID=158543 RepID=A0AAV7EI63_ARIFI|nr:hypothetical protein H6P81_013505 [Aristolochia fimbriata]